MSDHFSGPAALDDPASNITDFFAFPSPERPGSLVMIMGAFSLATPQSLFSDAVTYRFRLRPLTRSGGRVTPRAAEYCVDVRFDDAPERAAQTGTVVTSERHSVRFSVGQSAEQDGVRVYSGLASAPFSMAAKASIRTDLAGQPCLETATNTDEGGDVLAIVVEVPFAPIVQRFGGATLLAAVCETLVKRRGNPTRIERVGRPLIKNVVVANPSRDERVGGIELRDLYTREDAFALSPVYRPLYESRLDAKLACLAGFGGATAWPIAAGSRRPLRDLLIDDFLIVDTAHPFGAGGFLEIERACLEDRPHRTAGGRWLDVDIVDELLTLMLSGGRGERIGDGVDAPTRPASLAFPHIREPNNRTHLLPPAFPRS